MTLTDRKELVSNLYATYCKNMNVDNLENWLVAKDELHKIENHCKIPNLIIDCCDCSYNIYCESVK
jgi:hypothetical protein